jgi:hypothetical protein
VAGRNRKGPADAGFARAVMGRLGGDFFVDVEVFFNGGNALKRVIDFFLEADDVLDFFSEVVEVAADGFEFCADGSRSCRVKLLAGDSGRYGEGTFCRTAVE